MCASRRYPALAAANSRRSYRYYAKHRAVRQGAALRFADALGHGETLGPSWTVVIRRTIDGRRGVKPKPNRAGGQMSVMVSKSVPCQLAVTATRG
jgi:hypothetical protein